MLPNNLETNFDARCNEEVTKRTFRQLWGVLHETMGIVDFNDLQSTLATYSLFLVL